METISVQQEHELAVPGVLDLRRDLVRRSGVLRAQARLVRGRGSLRAAGRLHEQGLRILALSRRMS